MNSIVRGRAQLLNVSCVLLALSLAGCYGPTKTLPEPRTFVEEDVPETPPPQKAPPVVKPTQMEVVKVPEPPKLPPTPVRPPSVSDWTLDDLLTARLDGDELLPAAVTHFLQTSPQDFDTLWLATLLLTPGEQSPESAPTAAEPPQVNSAAATAEKAPHVDPPSASAVVLEYLSQSEHEIARQTLDAVLRGNAGTDLPPPKAVEIVLKASLENEPSHYEPFYQQLLTRPEAWRRPDDPQVSADMLQTIGFELIQPLASPQLREQLARHLVQPETPASYRERLGPWLAEETRENFAARVVLHNSDLLNAAVRQKYRQTFAPLNASAFDVLLGVKPVLNTTDAATPAPAAGVKPAELFASAAPGNLFAAERPKDEVAKAWDVARMFWSDEFAASVARDVALIADIGDNRELMLLSCNLPRNAVRQELRRALNRQWIDGVAPFEEAKLTFESIRDPGFLGLVKLMPREQRKPESGAKSKIQTVQPASTTKPSPEKEAKYAWMAASESFVRTINERLFTAARGRAKPARPLNAATASASQTAVGSGGSTPGGVPLELHRSAEITAEFHLSWPEDVPAQAGVTPDLLVIHYVRMEGEDRMSRVADQYKRQLAGSASRTTAKGQWVDSLFQDPATGRLRSVDVMISRDGPPPRTSTTAEHLIVELLWVEITDPS